MHRIPYSTLRYIRLHAPLHTPSLSRLINIVQTTVLLFISTKWILRIDYNLHASKNSKQPRSLSTGENIHWISSLCLLASAALSFSLVTRGNLSKADTLSQAIFLNRGRRICWGLALPLRAKFRQRKRDWPMNREGSRVNEPWWTRTPDQLYSTITADAMASRTSNRRIDCGRWTVNRGLTNVRNFSFVIA